VVFSWFVGGVDVVVYDFVTDADFLGESAVVESVLHDVCEVIEDCGCSLVGGDRG
jgi:hypothetical protein